MKTYCTYIMTNQRNTVLYTGVTNCLPLRVWQHQTKQNPSSFTAKYNVNKLVYYCSSESIDDAIAHEKQIKNFSRKRKEKLIHEMNPQWNDLSDEVGVQDVVVEESALLKPHPETVGHGIATLRPTPRTMPLRSQ